MNETMPRTPFSTSLSGSAREAERRILNIASGPKKRPPALFLMLVFAVCLLCGNLVSCQVAEVQPEPDTAGLYPYELSGELQTSLTVGERWEFTLQKGPHSDETGTPVYLLCRDRTTGEEIELDRDYNRETFGLRPFSGLLGQEGVVLERVYIPHTTPERTERVFYQVDENGPAPLLTCGGTLYAGCVAGREAAVSLMNPSSLFSGLDVHWLEDGQPRTLPLGDAMEAYLGLDHTAADALTCDLDADPLAFTLYHPTKTGEQGTCEVLPWDKLLPFLWDQADRAYTVELGKWKDKPLTLELEERRTEWWWSWQVDQIRVLLDGEVIQTILPPEEMPDAIGDLWSGVDCWGLYHYELGDQTGGPMLLDLNFDGCMDFGLVDGDTPARNIPYVFYLWDLEAEEFRCFHSFNYILEADEGQLFETIYGGNGGDTRSWYAWEDGRLVLARREEDDWLNYIEIMTDEGPREGYHTRVYVRENGQLVQKEDETHLFPG